MSATRTSRKSVRKTPRVESLDQKRERASAIVRLLRKEFPEAKTALLHASPFELLIATILSAQCTDERVNMTTPVLFQKFGAPGELAAADQTELEDIIRSTGF